jgi:CubicO group peptidase (beta-lactamase class C family)
MTQTNNSATDLHSLLESEMEQWAVPGAVVGILDRGRMESLASGVRRANSDEPVTTDTLFQVGSITKLFTATAAMQLIEIGVVDLDIPLRDYLPTFRLHDADVTQTLTLRHLLTHTGGTQGDRFFDEDFGTGDDALARCIARFDDLRQIFRPGEYWAYCNDGVLLAGYLVASTRQQPFEQIIKERLFEPLDLTRSVMSLAEAGDQPLATGHESSTGIPRSLPLMGWPRHLAPAANLISTVDDLLTFAAAHMLRRTTSRKLVNEQTVTMMQQPQVNVNSRQKWGLGWGIRFIRGTKIIEHSGGGIGQRVHLAIAPEEDLAVAVLTNSIQGIGLYGTIVEWVLDRYRGLRANGTTGGVDPGPLADFVGHYSQPITEVSVEREDDSLVLAIQPQGSGELADPVVAPVTLAPIGRDSFIITGGVYRNLTVDFLRGKHGGVDFIRLGELLAPRVKDMS